MSHATQIQEQVLKDALESVSLSTATTSQRMLGGLGISLKGTLFALLLPQGTALKLSPEDQERFLEMPGAVRYEIEGDPSRSRVWVVAPPELPDRTAHFASWVRKAFHFCERTVPTARRGTPKPGRAWRKIR